MPPARPVLVALMVHAAGVACGCAAPTARRAVPIEVQPPVVAPGVPVRPADDPEEQRAPARNGADAPGALAFVETLGDRGWLILAEGDASLLASAPVLATDPATGFTVLEAKVKLAALDPELRLDGRSFDLYDRDAKVCTVRSGPVRLLGVTETPGEEVDGEGPRPRTAADLWTYTSRFIALPVTLPEGCRTATWARLAELPEPRFARASSHVASAEAASQFRTAAGWHEAQERFDQARAAGSTAATGTWEEAATVVDTTWSAPFTGATWSMRQAVWDEGCGASASLTLAWRDAPAASTLLFARDDRFDVEVVVDLDGDGALEMIGTSWNDRELRGFFGTRADALRRYGVPEHGCGC